MKIDRGYTKINKSVYDNNLQGLKLWDDRQACYYNKPWRNNRSFVISWFTNKLFVCSEPRYLYHHNNGEHMYGIMCIIEFNNKFDLGHATLCNNPGDIRCVNVFNDEGYGEPTSDGYFYSTSTKITVKRDTKEGQEILAKLNKHNTPSYIEANLIDLKNKRFKLEQSLS